MSLYEIQKKKKILNCTLKSFKNGNICDSVVLNWYFKKLFYCFPRVPSSYSHNRWNQNNSRPIEEMLYKCTAKHTHSTQLLQLYPYLY